MPIQLEFHHENCGVIYRCLSAQHFSGAKRQLLDAPARIRNVKYIIVDAASMVPQYVSARTQENRGYAASLQQVDPRAAAEQGSCSAKFVVTYRSREEN
jgi:hypothetical protein